MAAVQKPLFSKFEHYLEKELVEEEKHELIESSIIAMAGASANHNLLSLTIARKFGNHLDDSPCRVFASDMRVRVLDNCYYPDVLVDCAFDKEQPYYTTSPIIIVEVLSKSTRKYDKMHKFMMYINNIPNLQEYVLIEQDFVEIEVVRRSESWVRNNYFLGDSITFSSIDLTLSVEEIYRHVDNDDMSEFLANKNGS